jgi:hypothetical protein
LKVNSPTKIAEPTIKTENQTVPNSIWIGLDASWFAGIDPSLLCGQLFLRLWVNGENGVLGLRHVAFC